MRPLQFQKRLLLAEDLDAASAGYRVGYEDASHLSRDYRRHFGQPPMRDAQRVRNSVSESGEPSLLPY